MWSSSGIPSTKSAFLCAFTLQTPHFLAFRAQNRGFCALLPSETLVFGHFEHKIGIFVSETAIFPWFWRLPSTKSGFLCAFASKFLPDAAWPGNSCRMANDATGGVGNSSAQTVGDHAPREWEDPQAKRCGGMERSGSLCGRACRSAEANALRLRRRRGCRCAGGR